MELVAVTYSLLSCSETVASVCSHTDTSSSRAATYTHTQADIHGMQTDKHTQTDMVVTILRSPVRGRVMNDKGDDVPYVCNMCYILFLFLLHMLPLSCFDLLLAFSFLVSGVCL